MASRRLQRADKAEEVFIEVVNYVVPALILIFLGAALHWKRKQTISLAAPDPGISQRSASHGEA